MRRQKIRGNGSFGKTVRTAPRSGHTNADVAEIGHRISEALLEEHRALSETTAQTNGLSTSLKETATQAESITASAETMVSSINEVAAAIEQVTANAAQVATATGQTTSSVNQVATIDPGGYGRCAGDGDLQPGGHNRHDRGRRVDQTRQQGRGGVCVLTHANGHRD